MFNYNKSKTQIEDMLGELTFAFGGAAVVTSVITGLVIVLNQNPPESAQMKVLPENVRNVIKATTDSTEDTFITKVHDQLQYVKKYCELEQSNKEINQAETIENTVYVCNMPDSDNKKIATLSKYKVPLSYTRHAAVSNNLYLLHKKRYYEINAELGSGMKYKANIAKYDFNLENELLDKSCMVSKYAEIPTYGLVDQSAKNKGKFILTSMDIQVQLACLKENGALVYKDLPKFNTFNYQIN